MHKYEFPYCIFAAIRLWRSQHDALQCRLRSQRLKNYNEIVICIFFGYCGLAALLPLSWRATLYSTTTLCCFPVVWMTRTRNKTERLRSGWGRKMRKNHKKSFASSCFVGKRTSARSTLKFSQLDIYI